MANKGDGLAGNTWLNSRMKRPKSKSQFSAVRKRSCGATTRRFQSSYVKKWAKRNSRPCCIVVQFFTDFFTKQNKKWTTLGNSLQRKALKNMTKQKTKHNPESGVLPLDDLPPEARKKTNRSAF